MPMGVRESKVVEETSLLEEELLRRKRAEERIKELEEKFRSIFESVNDCIAYIDRSGRILEVNERAVQVFGGSKEELMGKHFTKVGVVSPRDIPMLVRGFASALAGKKPTVYVCINNMKGQEIHLECSTTVVKRDDQLTGVIVMACDITERKRAEEALRESKEFSESLIASMQDGFSVLDSHGFHIDVNPALCQITGFSREELIGVGPPHPYWPPEAYEEIKSAFQKTLRGEFDDFELTFMRKDGERFPVIVSPSWTKDKQGNVVSYFATVKDITGRRRAEEEIRRRNEELLALNAIAETVSQSLDLSHILNSALDKVLEIMRVEVGGIYLVDEATPRLTLMAHRGVSEEFVRQVGILDIEKEVLKRVAEQGRLRRLILVSEQILKDTALLRRVTTAIAKEKLRSYIQLLIHVTGSPAGLLVVASHESRKFTAQEEELLSTIANQIGVGIENARLFEDMKARNLQTITALTTAVEARDPYTSGHSQEVTELAIAIARKMGLSAEEIENLRMAGLLHDIGKIAIPDSVLNKPSRLTSAERIMVESHPVIAAEIVGKVEALAHLVPIIRHHREQYDGQGYPDGLKGEEIPLLARVLGVADGFQAMTSERPYRPGMSTQEALAVLQEGAGKQWDPRIVKVFCRILKQGRMPQGKVDDSK